METDIKIYPKYFNDEETENEVNRETVEWIDDAVSVISNLF